MANKYLRHFPKPLLDDLVAGRWLPVVGAGMSLNATLPAGKTMPLWPRLGELLASDLVDFSPTGTLDAISAFQHEFGRSKLIERLTEILHIRDAQPGPAHQAFCEIPFDIVCTTNFDFLLDRQYDRGQRHLHTVVDEEQLSISLSPSGTLLLKLHGDLRHPSRLVVSEEDYDSFLNSYPLIATYLANLLIMKTAVFVGYSLDDPDFRQVWSIVTSRLGRTRRMAYAIMVDAGPSEIARYERRGVKVINLPGRKARYSEILSDTFRELHTHWRDNVLSASKVTEEEPLRELLLPRDAQSRLCFFSLSIDRVSLFRSEVFPLVQSLGFVPVTADDVISPGDNVNAKIDALIDRASVMVVEPITQHTRAEMLLALARRGRPVDGEDRSSLRIVVIDSEPTSLQDDVIGDTSPAMPVYRINGDNLRDDPQKFLMDLAVVLERIARDTEPGRGQEPQRLLQKGEGRAAIISAMTLLEARLRTTIQAPRSSVSTQYTSKYRQLSLRDLLEQASQQELISPLQRRHLDEWLKLRNAIVHTDQTVSIHKAREVVAGVTAIIRGLPYLEPAI